jgi:hypothetical protein
MRLLFYFVLLGLYGHVSSTSSPTLIPSKSPTTLPPIASQTSTPTLKPSFSPSISPSISRSPLQYPPSYSPNPSFAPTWIPSINPISRTVAPSTTRAPASSDINQILSTPYFMYYAIGAGVLIIIGSIVIYCCCCRTNTPKLKNFDDLFNENDLNAASNQTLRTKPPSSDEYYSNETRRHSINYEKAKQKSRNKSNSYIDNETIPLQDDQSINGFEEKEETDASLKGVASPSQLVKGWKSSAPPPPPPRSANNFDDNHIRPQSSKDLTSYQKSQLELSSSTFKVDAVKMEGHVEDENEDEELIREANEEDVEVTGIGRKSGLIAGGFERKIQFQSTATDAKEKNKEFFKKMREMEVEDKRNQRQAEESSLDSRALQAKRDAEAAAKSHDANKTKHYAQLGGAFKNTNALSRPKNSKLHSTAKF